MTAPLLTDDAGSAYVIVREGQQWTEDAKLVAAEPSANARFGYAVALSGDTVLVGAPGESTDQDEAGAAYLFSMAGDAWS